MYDISGNESFEYFPSYESVSGNDNFFGSFLGSNLSSNETDYTESLQEVNTTLHHIDYMFNLSFGFAFCVWSLWFCRKLVNKFNTHGKGLNDE